MDPVLGVTLMSAGAALSAALSVYCFVSWLTTGGLESTTNRWADALGAGLVKALSSDQEAGDVLLPSRWTFFTVWQSWLQLDPDETPRTLARELGKAFLLALVIGGGLMFLSITLGVGAFVVTCIIPFLLMRSSAQKLRQQAQGELPELMLLLSAEVAAGQSFENAITFMSRLPGALHRFLYLAVRHSEQEQVSLFTTADRRGVLVQMVRRLQDPMISLAFTSFDHVTIQGAHAAGTLRQNNETIIANKDRLMQERGQRMETMLFVLLTIFFMLPLLSLLLMPIGFSLMQAL